LARIKTLDKLSARIALIFTMTAFFTLTAVFLSVVNANLLAPRQSPSVNQEYINSVCNPSITTPGSTIPPCISITTIQTDCTSNGTTPLDYLASAECMCNPPSTFFADWEGCQQCLFVHGARSQQDLDTYSSIISSASNILCTGTPTADFAAIFSSVAATAAPATTGSTVLSDQFPSQSAVSLYYTASGSQGPGAISGSTTAATGASITLTTSTGTNTASGGFNVGGGITGTGSAGVSTATSSGSGSGAMVTQDVSFGGIVAVMGGLVIAAL
jgi:hypothetical protein